MTTALQGGMLSKLNNSEWIKVCEIVRTTKDKRTLTGLGNSGLVEYGKSESGSVVRITEKGLMAIPE